MSASRHEALLDRMLSKAGIGGYQRNVYLGTYEVDFLFARLSLVVEVDGPHHVLRHVRRRDQEKDNYLRALGYRVVRIPTQDLRLTGPEILRSLRRTISHLSQHPPKASLCQWRDDPRIWNALVGLKKDCAA